MSGTNKVITVIMVAALMIASGLIGYWSSPVVEDEGDSLGTYYQVSTYSRLSAGYFGGEITVEELLENGNYGIGTVEGIDGEMIIVDGIAYRAGTDLVPTEVPAGTMIPFAQLNQFSFGLSYDVTDVSNYSVLRTLFSDMAESGSYLAYGIIIHTEFESVTIRSVPGQDEPYPPLSDVVANQTTKVLQNVQGTMVGFLITDALDDINVAGFHLHFICDDLSYGGHVLDMSFDAANVQVNQLNSVTVTIIDP